MKLQKESLWLLFVIAIAPFCFIYRDTITVKNGVIYVYKTTWWCKKTKVKSMKSSCVGTVCARWKRGVNFVEVLDNQGRLFWKQPYQGLPDRASRACRAAEALKYAIKTGATFSHTHCRSALWAVVLMMLSLFCWFYKRAWRLERERLARNDSRTATKDGMVEFSSPQASRFKSRNGIQRLKTGHISTFKLHSAVKDRRCAIERTSTRMVRPSTTIDEKHVN